jgi:hypothetical protein
MIAYECPVCGDIRSTLFMCPDDGATSQKTEF